MVSRQGKVAVYLATTEIVDILRLVHRSLPCPEEVREAYQAGQPYTVCHQCPGHSQPPAYQRQRDKQKGAGQHYFPADKES